MRLSRVALIAAVVPVAIVPFAQLSQAGTAAPWSVRINVGGPAFTDTSGKTWLADQGFVGGSTYTGTAAVANTSDVRPYQSERYGMTGYSIPVPAAGIYNLKLKFSEIWFTGAAQRVFSVTAEGTKVVTDLDLVGSIGPKTAYDVSLPVRVTDGQLDIGFSATRNVAKLSGIELEAAPAGPTTSTPTPTPTPPPTPTGPQLYVSTSGNDSNSGSSAAPFRTVSKAASVASAGTTVNVEPGTYNAVTNTRSGTSTAPITFRSSTKWGAKITGVGQTSAWTTTGDFVVIQDFDISGSDYNGILATGNDSTFSGNNIHNLAVPTCTRGGGGIVAEGYSLHGNTSVGNVVHHILPPQPCQLTHGIYYQSPNAGRIINNVIYQVGGWGVHLWHNANHVTVSNNTIFECIQGGIIVGGSMEDNDIAPGVADYVTVTNNLVVNNRSWGIQELGRVGSHNTYANNLLFGNADGAYSITGGSPQSGTVSADPQFVRYQADGTGDYHLRLGSPAIDKGTVNGAPGYDYDMAGRPKGSAIDIGAFEGGR